MLHPEAPHSHPSEAKNSPAPWVLSASGLTCQRGERTLFENLHLTLGRGSVTWLRGRNGRGKTSLLRLLAGLSSPAAGEIHINGQNAAKAEPAWRSQWAYVAHQNALKDDLSATEALHFLARLHGLPSAPADLHQALRRMGIANRQHAPVRTLSQGQRRRVALARLALSSTAPLWLLDEPFDALDADGITALNHLIGEHAQAGGCVVLTSHQALTLHQPLPQLLDLEAFAPKAESRARA